MTQTYNYDDADKLTSVTQGGNTVKSFSYDTAGRTTGITVSGNTTTLAYDYESRITTITYPNSSTNTFTYNGLDTRVGKVDSTGTKSFLRDGADVTDPVINDGASYTPGISERRSGTTKFYHTDRLGSTERLTNTSQSTTDTREYDAFGLLTNSSGTTPTPFGFAGDWGYQEDPDSGLKLLGHRYYDPSTGRFLTRDPVEDGRNWYGYCDGSPLSSIDPAGLWSILKWAFTDDGNASDEVYRVGLEQGKRSFRYFLKHLGLNEVKDGLPAAVVIGPLPKVIPKLLGMRTLGDSWATSGVRIVSNLTRKSSLTTKLARGVKDHNAALWLVYQAGIFWKSALETVHDPDSWLPDK